jgi:hypothetical protein
MTAGGWVNLVLSVGFVTVLFAYCIIRVLRVPDAKRERHLARVEPLEKDVIDKR